MGKGKGRRVGRDDARPPGTRLNEARVGPAPRARRVWVALGVSTLLTTCLLYVLYTWGVPLGESGKFVYRYSKVLPERLARAGVLVPVMGVLAGALWLLARERTKALGLVVGLVGLVGLTAWTWWVPPAYLQQHSLNLLSPSHEGAFLIEAGTQVNTAEGIAGYLRRFDRERLTRSVEEMRGTRVLSNTPGTTVLAYGMLRGWPSDVSNPGVIERYLLDVDTRPEDVPVVASGIKFSIVLTALWGLSGVFAYLLGRQFLSPVGAGVFAVLVTFNPATANFVPGKDPAQLLTINAMLWAWFAGVKKRSSVWTGLAGALLTIGMAWGLIHLWVAIAAWLATFGYSMRRWESWGAMAVRFVAAPAVGAVVVVLMVYLATGWNVVATLAAVSGRYSEVQEWIKYDRGLWFGIGLPLFLLFVSPVVYAMVGLSRGRWQWRKWTTKWYILSVTMGVVVLVYVVGVTYELPRLWVAFVPLLTLGAMVEMPAFRGKEGRRVVGLAIALVIVNVMTTAMHVAALDARESEFRLMRGAGPGIFE